MGIRVTLRDIAEATAVSKSTVSLALRDDRRISQATRDRIRAVAREMGYRPDPTLAALAKYKRRRIEPELAHPNIAILVTEEILEEIKMGKHTAQLYNSIKERLYEMGYAVERITIDASERGQRSVSRVLYNHGIRGLFLMTSPIAHNDIQLEWERFTAIGLLPDVPNAFCPTIIHNHFESILTCVAKLRELGYQRPGIYVDKLIHDRTGHRWAAALNQTFYIDNGLEPPPVMVTKNHDAKDLARWVRENQIDVVLHGGISLRRLLNDAGFQVPAEVGEVALDLDAQASDASGIVQDRRVLGIKAANALHGMLLNNEYCPIESPGVTLVPGEWRDGATLRPVRPNPSASRTRPNKASIVS